MLNSKKIVFLVFTSSVLLMFSDNEDNKVRAIYVNCIIFSKILSKRYFIFSLNTQKLTLCWKVCIYIIGIITVLCKMYA